MRIIYAHTEPWISASPAVTFVTLTSLGLARAGVETHLIVPASTPGETGEILHEHFDEQPAAPLTVHRLKADSRRAFRADAAALAEELSGEGDGILIRSLFLLPAFLGVRKAKGCRLFFETHDCHWAPWDRDDVSTLRELKPCLRERRYLPRVDGLVCLREVQADVYRGYLGKRVPVHVAPTGIRVRPQARAFAEDPVFAYIGSLDPHKGLRNVARLAGELPRARFLIVGGKNDKEIEQLQNLFWEHDCEEERLRVTGWISYPQMVLELADAHWGLCPLQDNYFNRYLTSPLKVHDMLGLGLPLIATDLPTLSELVTSEQNGLLVRWGEPKQIAEWINRIEAPAYSRMVQTVRRQADAWTWTHRGAALAQAFGSKTSHA